MSSYILLPAAYTLTCRPKPVKPTYVKIRGHGLPPTVIQKSRCLPTGPSYKYCQDPAKPRSASPQAVRIQAPRQQDAEERGDNIITDVYLFGSGGYNILNHDADFARSRKDIIRSMIAIGV